MLKYYECTYCFGILIVLLIVGALFSLGVAGLIELSIHDPNQVKDSPQCKLHTIYALFLAYSLLDVTFLLNVFFSAIRRKSDQWVMVSACCNFIALVTCEALLIALSVLLFRFECDYEKDMSVQPIAILVLIGLCLNTSVLSCIILGCCCWMCGVLCLAFPRIGYEYL